MLAKLQPNLHVRRKSSPAITGLDAIALRRIAENSAASTSSSASTQPVKIRQKHSQLFVSESIANRRLSSPPCMEKDVDYFNYIQSASGTGHHRQKNAMTAGAGGYRHKKNYADMDCCDDAGNGSGSSSTGSLHKLHCISGLNPSSSDLRVNTVISGHKVTVFFCLVF